MRAKKIIESVKESGVKPYKEGRHNFKNPNPKIESLAKKRIEICKGCEFFKSEKVDFLKVQDKRIPEASERYCEDCGCIIAYKIRQSKKLCEKWQEKE